MIRAFVLFLLLLGIASADQIRLDWRAGTTGNFAPRVLTTLPDYVITFNAAGEPIIGPGGGGGVGVTDGDKGDITVSGGGTVWTIDPTDAISLDALPDGQEIRGATVASIIIGAGKGVGETTILAPWDVDGAVDGAPRIVMTSGNSPSLEWISPEVDVASGTTTDLGAAASRSVRITGTTGITGLGTVAAGVMRFGRFADALTLTHNATSLILPNAGANITTAANDRFSAVSLGSGNWLVYDYQRADGTSLVGGVGGGSVATDTIFDAKGDLAVGTGADTAARLAAGTNNFVLTADSATATGLKWAAAGGGGDVYLAANNAFTGNNSFAGTLSAVSMTLTGPVSSIGSYAYFNQYYCAATATTGFQNDSATGIAFPSDGVAVLHGNAGTGWNSLRFGGSDLALGRLGVRNLRLGEVPSATPLAQTVTIGEASRPGTDSNIAGASGTIQSGLGTGTGTASSLIFQTPTVAASGSATQTYATRLTLAAAGATFSGNVTATTLDAGVKVITKQTGSNYTIGTTDARELYGGVIYVTGAATITIPAVADGANFTVITIGAVAVSVDPNAADKIYLDGTALDDGDKINNLSTAGDIVTISYFSADGWYASTNGWTDGG